LHLTVEKLLRFLYHLQNSLFRVEHGHLLGEAVVLDVY
jgi:hypothetical protein